jgi:hypothetical protein
VTGEQGDATPDPGNASGDLNAVAADADGEATSAPSEDQQREGQSPEQPPSRNSRYRKWRQRDSIDDLHRMVAKQQVRWRKYDQRDNDLTRLPQDETVCLGGLVLAEAFTPSTASNLRKALEEFPESKGEKQEWLRNLTDGRSATGSGAWSSLGVIRRSGTFGIGGSDPEVPAAVDAIWLHMLFLTPSVTMIVATFTIKDEEGDLSSLLRADYKTTVSGPRIEIRGRFSPLQRRNPWSRPKLHSVWWTPVRAEAQKALACESKIAGYERECWKWISRRFPGVFVRAGFETTPIVRLLITRNGVPFQDYERELAPVNLASKLNLWNSKNEPGWKLSFSHRSPGRESLLIAATRAGDAARSSGSGISGDTVWHLTQVFADSQSSLIAGWALSRLLALYADRLSSIRDRAGRQVRLTPRLSFRRPVREARDLDEFLMRDGLDAATIISDVKDATSLAGLFSLGEPSYEEDLSNYPSRAKSFPPRDLAPTLEASIKSQAERLNRDTEAATTNIAASAELRQSIANTRLQRSVIFLTIITIAIALASLYVSLHTDGLNNSSPKHAATSQTTRPSSPSAAPRSPSPSPRIP